MLNEETNNRGPHGLFSSQSHGLVDIDALMSYLPACEGSAENANPARSPAPAAARSLGEWLSAHRRASDGADVSEWIAAEAESVLLWAEANRRIIDNQGFDRLRSGYRNLAGESEHDVFHVSESKRVIKTTIPPNFGARGAAEAYLTNALRNNEMFGDDVHLHGVMRMSGGPVLVISQPFIDGTRPTLLEIARWFEDQGYVAAGIHRWKHPASGADIADAHAGNLLKDPAGNLIPIDLQILKPASLPL